MRLLGKDMALRDVVTSPVGLIGLAILGVGGYSLWTNHREHVVDALVYLPLAACMLMHFFMHGGHGHGHGTGSEQSQKEHRHITSRHEEKP
ncbi:DUF2933 domain-containing protein [Shumkonia mesophila]|uniref:DUF2933 domain-containing protein n=1 Tax=Shumkonia mesophila TaxID=2838854 RepID=UPI0029344EE8|nr:DUF2933 domain-containing protein [Shumkonia mesophila]